jgi:hypothetical protein
MRRKAEVKQDCQCERCMPTDGETLERHMQRMEGMPALHVYRRGPALPPSRDGLVVCYDQREHEVQ